MMNPPDDPIAAGGGGPPRSRAGRFGWLVAGAAAVAGVAAVALLASSGRGPNVGASPTASGPVSIVTCTAAGLAATVGQWEGAAGHRIGMLKVTNTGSSACSLPAAVTPSLIDRNGRDLIVGKAATLQPVTIPIGGSLETLVQAGNYCGPTALEPATIVLAFTGQRLVAQPAAGDTSSGVPPCSGEAGPTDSLTIQPWRTPQG